MQGTELKKVISQAIDLDFSEDQRQQALIMLGRAQAADRISVALSAEVVRFIEHFEKTKMYRALGHATFVDFLNNSGLSDVTKNKYYDRKRLLDREGDPLYDQLTLAGVPVRDRKELNPGDVVLEGETIYIAPAVDGADPLPIHKDNFTGIVDAIKKLNAERRQLMQKLEKGTEDFRRERERRLNAEDALENGNGGNGHRLIPALEKVHTVAIGGLAALAGELEKLSEEEASGYCEREFTLLVTQYNRVNQILCEKLGELPADIEELLSD